MAARRPIYCGNNSLAPELTSRQKRRGTRHECFKKGIGIGKHLPVDDSYNGPFAPIDARKIYCGTANRLPRGYHSLGNAPTCLQKGVSVGKKIHAEEQKD
jgi:hypothetical protein